MPSGGLHPPANPAATSGPGALSQRTDGKQPVMAMTGGKYGETGQLNQIQSGAAMPQTPPADGGAATAPVDQGPPPTPINAPTENPGEPVTAGAAAGPGAGTSALNLPPGDTPQQLRAVFAPILPALLAQAQSGYATQAYKDSVKALLASM
jgi:hypothetical protein